METKIFNICTERKKKRRELKIQILSQPPKSVREALRSPRNISQNFGGARSRVDGCQELGTSSIHREWDSNNRGKNMYKYTASS